VQRSSCSSFLLLQPFPPLALLLPRLQLEDLRLLPCQARLETTLRLERLLSREAVSRGTLERSLGQPESPRMRAATSRLHRTCCALARPLSPHRWLPPSQQRRELLRDGSEAGGLRRLRSCSGREGRGRRRLH